MEIGYYTYGALSNDVQSSVQDNGKIDCFTWSRELYLDWLVNQEHTIYLMNSRKIWNKHNLFESVKNSERFSPKEFFKVLNWVTINDSISIDKTWRYMYKNLNKVNWPNIDMLIIDNNHYPFMPIFTYKLMMILYYKNKIPVLILDDDNETAPLLERANKILDLKIENDIYIATHFKKKIYPKQFFLPFVYNQKLEKEILPVDKLEHDYVYIGHDYKRREKAIKYYFDFASKYKDFKVEIYGDWKNWLSTKKYSEKHPKNIINNTVSQSKSFEILNKSLATCQIVMKYYEQTGQMTLRIIESTACGCPLLADGDIFDIKELVLNDNIVNSTENVHKKLEELKSQNFNQRKEMIESQRNILKQFTIDKSFSGMFNEIFK